MDVKLELVGWHNFHDVIDLELEKEQEKNLPSNLYSIAESSLSPLFHPRVITLNDKAVGFLMYQFGKIGAADENECTIWRFMVERGSQNKGIGIAAMDLALRDILSHDRCDLVDIYYEPNNLPAKKLYARYGFAAVGFRDDGDVIAEVSVTELRRRLGVTPA